MGLIEAWSNFDANSQPHILKEDQDYFENNISLKKNFWCGDNWTQQKQNLDYLDPKNKKFHFGLLPVPYCGNLNTASIYILMLNPGLGSGDYYAEYEGRDFKDVLLENLKQTSQSYFFPLDPKFSWTGAFMYWHKKLEGLIAEMTGGSFHENRDLLRKEIASLEIFPYHSRKFKAPEYLLWGLPSAILARDYVKNTILDKVKSGDAILIAARGAKFWDIQEKNKDKIIIYAGSGEAQSAHLSPKSRGGKA